MAPPKGFDFTEQLEAAELLKDKVHGINVTDMQSACLKASSLGLCIKLKTAGFEEAEWQSWEICFQQQRLVLILCLH